MEFESSSIPIKRKKGKEGVREGGKDKGGKVNHLNFQSVVK